MTQFVIIRTAERIAERVDLPTLQAAESRAGLGNVDHGTIAMPFADLPGIAYVVYEYGLFADRNEQSYCAIGKRLIAGNTVLYGFDVSGDTVDMPAILDPRWFANADEVEAAIAAGEVDRPRNTALGWEWPQAKPASFPG